MTTRRPRDRDWLEALFAAHHRAVLQYALRRVRPDEADDVVAEVFASAWQQRERVPEPALAWLYRTACHHVLHAHRGHSRRDRLFQRLSDEPALPGQDHADAVVGQVDDARRVQRALADLTPRDAEILRLSAWEDLRTDEIAFVLDCTSAAAKVRLHRARRRFATALHRSDQPQIRTIEEATA